jgi:hypothetical protein
MITLAELKIYLEEIVGVKLKDFSRFYKGSDSNQSTIKTRFDCVQNFSDLPRISVVVKLSNELMIVDVFVIVNENQMKKDRSLNLESSFSENLIGLSVNTTSLDYSQRLVHFNNWIGSQKEQSAIMGRIEHNKVISNVDEDFKNFNIPNDKNHYTGIEWAKLFKELCSQYYEHLKSSIVFQESNGYCYSVDFNVNGFKMNFDLFFKDNKNECLLTVFVSKNDLDFILINSNLKVTEAKMAISDFLNGVDTLMIWGLRLAYELVIGSRVKIDIIQGDVIRITVDYVDNTEVFFIDINSRSVTCENFEMRPEYLQREMGKLKTLITSGRVKRILNIV